jgi:hypothetical protein
MVVGHLPSSSEVNPLRALREWGGQGSIQINVSGTIIKLEGMLFVSYRPTVLLIRQKNSFIY